MIKEKYFTELNLLLDNGRDCGISLSNYGNNRDGLYPLLITISHIANKLWYISINIKSILRTKLINGEIIAHGIDKNIQSIDMM